MARTSEPSAEPLVPAAPLTQRAYTLRLRRPPGACNACRRNDCTCGRDALWATHEAVNKGAKVFGDWLLTLRGGLSHEQVDRKVVEGKGANKKERDPTDAERRDRRILLALSWLSVESAPRDGDPAKQYLVAECGSSSRELALRAALCKILQQRGVPASEIGNPNMEPENQPNAWLGQCGPSLAARIRDDAVWVNRSAMFDAATTSWDRANASTDTHTLLSFILSDEFLTLPTSKRSTKDTKEGTEDDEDEERQKAVKASSKGAGQRTRHPFSHLLGEGKPFGKPQRNLVLRDKWRSCIKAKLEAVTGIPVVDPQNRSRGKNKDSGPAHTELQREMFSKAASRVAQIVTKQRQQEADRLARKAADAELRQMEANHSYDAALTVLREYCDEYRVTSGATGEFMIRPRQVTGWDRVVKRWAAIKEADPEAAREARIEAVKEAQDADEEKKFGDANLFIRLADDRYTSVWQQDSTPDPTILERFVRGMKARSDSDRLKVAAFRHPDPYFNPIFCQFGVSRPAIHFRRLKAFSNDPGGNDPRSVGMLLWHPACGSARLTLLHGASHRIDREIGSACDQVQPNAEALCAVSRRGRLGAAAAGLPSADSPARVAGVFDLKRIESRSRNDDQEGEGGEGNGNGKLKEPKWNGTLSANRRELAVIGKLIEKRDIQKATLRCNQLRWTLTVSMEMEGRGPWFRYVATAQDQTPFVRTVRKDRPTDRNDPTKGLVERKGNKRIVAEGWPWQEFNKPLKDNNDNTTLVEDAKAARGDKACLILSRLPGLRVLSVDLGHRFAASCAVWEAISAGEMVKACRGHDHREPRESDLFIHLTRTVKKERKKGRDKGKAVDVVETTIYRRIGSDKLPDGSEHPTPWARLDRQFFIKLQGEERPARAATNGKLKDGSPTETNEVEMVAKLARDFGLRRDEADESTGRGVDELMRRAVRIATLGLKRHGRMAKIAYAFNPDCPGIPGMGGTLKAITRGDDDHVKFLTNALADWHALATDTEWDGSAARKLWNEHVKPLQAGFDIADPAPPDSNAERPTRQQRRKSEEELREKLKPIAEHFAKAKPEFTSAIHNEWAKLWTNNDGIERKSLSDAAMSDFAHTLLRDESGKVIGSLTNPKPGKESPGGWHAHIRLLTDWVMGWHLPNAQSKHWNRNVGGLSLTRITTMRALYQLHKSFAMRPRPDDVRGAPEKGESNAGVAQSLLDAMERMREQRVKQIASRIVEAALGVGIERDRVWDDEKKKWRYPKRPRSLLYHEDSEGNAHGDPRFKTCHAVVIENLRNYRPDELQTRRENRALMNWSAGKVRKYLEEACQLHALHLREVSPRYTSQQCSRTGLPGVRCVDVPVDPETGKPNAYWWKKALSAAKTKIGNGDQDGKKGDAESRFIVDLANDLPGLRAKGESLPKTVRVPRKGGDLFIAAPPWSCRTDGHRPCPLCDAKRALQADLNAAANIGLRALLDPDFPGKWWYIPATIDAGWRVPAQKSCAGAACLHGWKVAPKDDYLAADGQPLTAADNETVKQAEEVAAAAKKEVDAAKRAAKKRGADQKVLGAAKDRYEKAKAALMEAKKAASQKEIINIWQDPAAVRSGAAAGRWRETTAYWNIVRSRVVDRLRDANGLDAADAAKRVVQGNDP